jgi:sugar/nucleoside kinase (ribokinase family)
VADRVLGVVGTLVWDTIHRRGNGDLLPVEEWGGIGYALEALSVALPDGWTIRPILKVGKDLSESAYRFLREIPRVDPETGVMVVPEPNNRVEIVWLGDGDRRAERLTGGVPPWHWLELGARLDGCDALYVNFISGFEMELETARALRAGFSGPIWADLHSLFLGMGRHGDRIPRPLPDAVEWISSFDAVQMNDDEFALLGRVHGDAWLLAAAATRRDVRLMAVTMGPQGAGYVTGADFTPDPFSWPGARHRIGTPGASVSGRVPAPERVEGGDPTGCGDVWGSTTFARLLAGDSLEAAFHEGTRLATRNATHHGARGLRHHLRFGVVPGVPSS